MARLKWLKQGNTYFANPEPGLQYMFYSVPKAGKGTVFCGSVLETKNGKVRASDIVDHPNKQAAKLACEKDYADRGNNPITPKSRQKRAKNPVGAHAKLAGKGVYIVQGYGIPWIRNGKDFLVNKAGQPGSPNATPGLFTRAQAEAIVTEINGGRAVNPVNGNYGFTIWVKDKHGTVKQKQRTGYPDKIAAIQGAYIAMQKPDAYMPGHHNAIIFDRTNVENKKPPNSSETLSLNELKKIVETKSPEFCIGRKLNPVPEGRLSKLKKATALYESFRDKPGSEILEMDMPDLSHAMVIGRCTAIEYDTVRGTRRENYRHKFHKHAAPLLCCASDGKTLFTVGGDFTFTERGITDAGE